MLSYTDLKPGKKIVLDGEPYVVLEYSFVRKQMRKPVVQTKIRHLITGNVVEKAFYPRDVVEEAEVEVKEIKYLYANRGEYWFCSPKDPADRFSLGEDVVGSKGRFMKANSLVNLHLFGEKVVDVALPIKVELKVTEAAPAVRGNTAQGVTKQVKLESGANISVPIFINEGAIVRVNTETGEYVERVEKAK